MIVALSAILATQSFEPGITLRVYDIGADMSELMELVPGQTPNIDRRIDAIDLKEGEFGFKDNFIAELSGEFNALTSGEYTFRIRSDDGSAVSVDGKTVAENDGVHPPTSVEGKIKLSAGWHKIGVRFFEAGGGEELKLEYKSGSSDYAVADKSVLRCPAGLTRVVSPGTKAVKGLGGVRRPGNGMPLDKLHPGWSLIKIRPDDFKPQVGSMAFLSNGSLLLGTFKPNQSGVFQPELADGRIYRLDNVIGDAPNPKVTLVAENLQEPLGMAVHDGHVYVALRDQIAELIDKDGDGAYEGRKTIAKGWGVDNYHHFTFGLAVQDGYLYAALSTSITGDAPGINGPNPMYRGSVLRVDPRIPFDPAKPNQNCEFITGGHRTPNGISNGPFGLVVVGENQGSWQPSNKLNIVAPGGFYGHYNNTTYKNAAYPEGGVRGVFDRPELTPPGIYLPQNEIANSPGTVVVIPSGPNQNQMLISDVKYGGLRRGWLEMVDGQWQGGAVQYSQGFEVGTNRLLWGPDGNLYIGGIGATETWAWTDPATKQWTTFGLQKIKPTGKDAFEIMRVSARPGGFQVDFSRPIQNLKPDQIVAKQWNYAPTVEYGGDKKNRETLAVKSVKVINDHSVTIDVPGLKSDRVVYLNIGAKSIGGDELWASECWYTMNRLPAAPKPVEKPIKVLVFSKTAAFRHDSIPTAVEAVKGLPGLDVTATEDSAIFASKDLFKFDVVMFLSTTGDVLNDEQQKGFESFIKRGKGYVGIHAAADTEYDWPFYGQVVGAYFKGHPAIQQVRIDIEKDCPETHLLPRPWNRVDELYNYKANPRPNVEVLATLNEKTYQGGDMSGDHPIIWRHKVAGGRAWYCGLGHTQSSWHELLFMQTVAGGIRWAAGR